MPLYNYLLLVAASFYLKKHELQPSLETWTVEIDLTDFSLTEVPKYSHHKQLRNLY